MMIPAKGLSVRDYKSVDLSGSALLSEQLNEEQDASE